MKFTRKFRLTAVIAAGVLAMSACSSGPAEGPESGGLDELVIGSSYEHDGYDPLNPLSASANGERLIPVFDTLLRVLPDGSVGEQLAKGMESADGKTWTLHLREGVTFTDGTPLDGEAVIYNIERHRAPESPSSSKFLLATLESMTSPKPTEVVFTLSQSNHSFPYLFTSSGALGLIGSPTALKADAEGFNRAPIGAGPYIVEEWVADDHVTMTANPDYWGGEPEIGTLTYRVLPDAQSRENALVADQIQITSISGNFQAIMDNDDLHVYTQGNRGAVSLLPNTSVAPFNDQRVRTATQIAFDPASTNKAVFGNATLWDGKLDCLPFESGTAQCEPSTVKTDLDRAKKLIAEYKADGGDTKVKVIGYSFQANILQYVDQVYKSIGLESEIVGMNPSEFIPVLYSGDFQVGLWSMAPFDSFYPLGYTIFSGSSRNVTKQDDAEFNAAIEQGVNASSADDRNAGLRDFQRILNEKAYAVWLAPMPTYVVSSTQVDLGDKYRGGLAFYPTDIKVK